MKYPGIQKIIDILKNIDDSPESNLGFDMSQWYNNRKYSKHQCGTACCIAGWAQTQVETPELVHPVEALVTYCELENCDRLSLWELVSPNFSQSHNFSHVVLNDLTLSMAIKVLEIFRDTGEVKWHEVVSHSI